MDICAERALDKCPVQIVALFCHLVQSCSVVFSDVEGCSVVFEGSQKYSVDKIKFFCLKKTFSRFAIPLNSVQFVQAHCKYNSGPYFWRRRHVISADLILQREYRDDKEEMESSALAAGRGIQAVTRIPLTRSIRLAPYSSSAQCIVGIVV